MILKLKRKFVMINMLLVLIVLAVVFTVLCFSTYNKQSQSESRSLDLLLKRGDEPAEKFEIGQPSGMDGAPQRNDDLIAGFVVTIDASGEQSVTSEEAVSVSDEVASAVSEIALSSDSDSGIIRSYSLRYLKVTEDDVTRIAFLDVSSDLSAMTELVVTSLLVGALALAAFFAVSLFLASLALKPVATAWSRQKQFVADASHELKTPLTVILANQKILLSHPERTVGQERQWIENTQSEGTRMKTLVEDMLFLAKADSERVHTVRAGLNLSELAQGALLSFASVAFEANVTLEDDIQPDVTLPGDAGQLTRLCGILLDNAVKYADRGGTARLTLSADGANCRLAVFNTGAPIPESELPHLFERFYRADRARSAGGFGLGLSIAENIARSHGGRITVSSGAGGTTFTVALPLSPAGKHRKKERL
ncbi:MAG: HAMP domain-containing sensor histidine kinase [Clostridiaceae bacterium]